MEYDETEFKERQSDSRVFAMGICNLMPLFLFGSAILSTLLTIYYIVLQRRLESGFNYSCP